MNNHLMALPLHNEIRRAPGVFQFMALLTFADSAPRAYRLKARRPTYFNKLRDMPDAIQ
jgi:hypothetical protein